MLTIYNGKNNEIIVIYANICLSQEIKIYLERERERERERESKSKCRRIFSKLITNVGKFNVVWKYPLIHYFLSIIYGKSNNVSINDIYPI